jgi:hypothetical protein
VVANANRAKPTFWSRVTIADAELIRYAADISKDPEKVVEAYRMAFSAGAGSTPRERQSVSQAMASIAALIIAEQASGRVRQVAAEVGKLE